MNILCLAFNFPANDNAAIVSGEVKNAYNFIKELGRRNDNKVTVINITDSIDAEQYSLGELQVYVARDIRTRGIFRYLYRAVKIRNIINGLLPKATKFDFIHSHISYGTFGALISNCRKVPIITTPHGTNIQEIKTELTTSAKDWLRRINAELQRLLDIYSFKNSTLAISVSQFQLHEMQELYHVHPEMMKVIYNGVDQSRYHSALSLKTAESASCNILFVGRACKKKGLDKIKELAQRNPRWKFDVIVGNLMFNTIGDELIQAINSLPNCKTYTSVPEPELPKFYQKADVTIIPSRGYESLPTVILESIACGTPAVSVNAWGNPEVIIEPQLMFKENDIEDMERSIRFAMDHNFYMHTAYSTKFICDEVNKLIFLILDRMRIEK